MAYKTKEQCQESVGPGWAELVACCWHLCQSVQPPIEVMDAKEKFGRLRVCVGSAPVPILNILDQIEILSSEICELCGAPGKKRAGGWIKTLCDDCAESR